MHIELNEAYFTGVTTRLQMRAYLTWVLPVFFGLVMIKAISADGWDPFEVLVIPALVAAVIYATLVWTGHSTSKRMYRTTKALHQPMKLVLTPHLYDISGPGHSMTESLSMLHAVVETKSEFLVYVNVGHCLIWPKASITDRPTLERVREYLRQGLPGTAKVKLRKD